MPYYYAALYGVSCGVKKLAPKRQAFELKELEKRYQALETPQAKQDFLKKTIFTGPITRKARSAKTIPPHLLNWALDKINPLVDEDSSLALWGVKTLVQSLSQARTKESYTLAKTGLLTLNNMHKSSLEPSMQEQLEAFLQSAKAYEDATRAQKESFQAYAQQAKLLLDA